MSHDLHAALLNCALEVVMNISTGQDASRAFPWATQQIARGSSMMSLWDAIRCAGHQTARHCSSCPGLMTQLMLVPTS